ncbi:MAG TPA: o-succinylbenzoate synthase [Candidatus Wallbacteria bacterium]|nr:o-succinylbenzoate synthase [Candidatus Wallbacteria bacterium]
MASDLKNNAGNCIGAGEINEKNLGLKELGVFENTEPLFIHKVTVYKREMKLCIPFETSFGRFDSLVRLYPEITFRRADGSVICGIGECSPLSAPWYDYECHKSVETALGYIISSLDEAAAKNTPVTDVCSFIKLYKWVVGHNMARAGVEGAYWDALAKMRGVSVSELWGCVKKTVEAGTSVGLEPTIDALMKKIETAVERMKAARIKVKIKPGKDIEYVAAIRARYPRIRLQVDANAAYDLFNPEHIGLLKRLDEFDLMMIEQPGPNDDIYDHARTLAGLKTPICMDESILSAAHARQAIELWKQYSDVSKLIINIKPPRVGGYLEAIKIARLCSINKVSAWCGGMHESAMGKTANVHFSAREEIDLPGDHVSQAPYFVENIADSPEYHEGTLKVPTGAGWGLTNLKIGASSPAAAAKEVDPVEFYNQAVEKTPAYKKFIETACGGLPSVKSPEDFKKLPFMDKPSYINAYAITERCSGGALDRAHFIAHSSGTSGKHVYWPCSRETEIGYWKRTFEELDRNYKISSTPTLVVLGLLMGGNLSGALFAYVLRAIGIETGTITLITPGREEKECMEAIAEFSKYYRQTILFSYGPTAKNILERLATEGVDIKKYNIKLRLIGEGYSESFRDRVNELLGYPYGFLTSISSGYGATDFRSVGKETPLCIAIKRLLHENGLLKKILGYETMPTICQYSPSDIFIEEVDGELVMTRPGIIPLIRYRSNDAGFVMDYDKMMALVKENGLDPFKLMSERGYDPAGADKKPFVIVSGRKDGLTFMGSKLSVGVIKAVIERVPYLNDRLSGEFQMSRYETENGDPRLALALVPKAGAEDIDLTKAAELIADKLGEIQGGIYAKVLADNRSAAVPAVKLVRREEIMTPVSFKIRWIA